jgi:N-acetylneuraminate synthase
MQRGTIESPAGKFVLSSESTFIVFEAGINHNGLISVAKHLVDVAADAGCNAIKFQKRDPHVTCKGREDEPLESQWGTTLLDKYLGRELSVDECMEVYHYSVAKGLHCFWSIWDKESMDALKPLWYKLPAIKIPSARMHDEELLMYINEKSKAHRTPIIFGTGMCDAEHIEKINEWFKGRERIYLQCTSSYPCKPEDVHLDVMVGWQAMNLNTGYSGHEIGFYPTLAAVARGALMVERHGTIDKTMQGTDHAISLEPQEFREMVKAIREINKTHGSIFKKILPCEEQAIRRLK